MQLAAELAAEEINAAGGIGGRPLELVIRDDYADPDSAVFVASDLYDSGVSAVSAISSPAPRSPPHRSTTAGDDPVAAISPSSSSPEVSSAGDYTFRVCPSDLAHGAALAQWVREHAQPRARRGALPERSIRPRHPADLRRGLHCASADGSRRWIPISATGRMWDPISIAWRGTRAPVSRGGRQPRRGGGNPPPGQAPRDHRPQCWAATASRGSRRPARWRKESISPRPTSPRSPPAPTGSSWRPTAASFPRPACPTSRPPRPTMRSTS